MDLRLLLLSLTTFAAGLAESILIGILPPLAEDLRVSISLAGQLTTLFSLGFALAAPLLGWLTRRIERRRLLLATLLLFALSNALAALAPGYLGLLLARLGMSACCGLLIVLASLLAAELAAPAQRGRAIGLIFMGISGSLVFGVPLGVQISDWFGWRWIFAGIAVYSLPLCLLLWRYLPQRQAGDLPGREGYLRQLRQPALWLAQLVSILLLGGHFTLFAYFTPYLASMAGIRSPSEISLILLLIGLAALSGGYIGGWLADRLGHRRALRLVPAAFALALAAVPLSLGSIGFLPVLMVWSAISWMISPVVQSFLLRSDPASGSAGVALNTSAMHLGVGLGAALGGLVVAALGVAATPWVGLALVLAALACALGASTLDGATQALPFSPPALHRAVDRLIAAHQADLGAHADADAGQLGFLEVGDHIEGLLVDQRHHRLARRGVVALGQAQVGHLAVARGAQLAALEVEFGDLHLGQRLLVLAASDGSIDLGVFLVLGADRADAQAAAPGRLVLAQQVLLVTGLGDGAGLLQVGLVAFLVDAHQHVADLDHLVVLDLQVGHPAGHVRRHHHHVGPHPGIAGPGREHVVAPEPDAGEDSGSDHQQGDDDAKRCTHANLLLGATIQVVAAQVMPLNIKMNRAQSNSASCQTQRRNGVFWISTRSAAVAASASRA